MIGYAHLWNHTKRSQHVSSVKVTLKVSHNGNYLSGTIIFQKPLLHQLEQLAIGCLAVGMDTVLAKTTTKDATLMVETAVLK